MNTRLASFAAALVLSLWAPAAALAQSAAALGQPTAQTLRTTGSYEPQRGPRGETVLAFNATRSVDSSAKGGNAEHTNFAVPNFGTTAGGPAY